MYYIDHDKITKGKGLKEILEEYGIINYKGITSESFIDTIKNIKQDINIGIIPRIQTGLYGYNLFDLYSIAYTLNIDKLTIDKIEGFYHKYLYIIYRGYKHTNNKIYTNDFERYYIYEGTICVKECNKHDMFEYLQNC